jgi:hypothetical protein
LGSMPTETRSVASERAASSCLLRYFLFIAEDLDQFTFVCGGLYRGWRGQELFCD